MSLNGEQRPSIAGSGVDISNLTNPDGSIVKPSGAFHAVLQSDRSRIEAMLEKVSADKFREDDYPILPEWRSHPCFKYDRRTGVPYLTIRGDQLRKRDYKLAMQGNYGPPTINEAVIQKYERRMHADQMKYRKKKMQTKMTTPEYKSQPLNLRNYSYSPDSSCSSQPSFGVLASSPTEEKPELHYRSRNIQQFVMRNLQMDNHNKCEEAIMCEDDGHVFKEEKFDPESPPQPFAFSTPPQPIVKQEVDDVKIKEEIMDVEEKPTPAVEVAETSPRAPPLVRNNLPVISIHPARGTRSAVLMRNVGNTLPFSVNPSTSVNNHTRPSDTSPISPTLASLPRPLPRLPEIKRVVYAPQPINNRVVYQAKTDVEQRISREVMKRMSETETDRISSDNALISMLDLALQQQMSIAAKEIIRAVVTTLENRTKKEEPSYR